MRSPAPRTTLLSTAALAAALLLSACGGGGSDPVADKAPAPAAAVPTAVSKAVASDVGEFLVQPKAGTPKAQIDGTIAKLKADKNVQSVTMNADGFVDVTLKPALSKDKRAEVVKQMAALGEVTEGI